MGNWCSALGSCQYQGVQHQESKHQWQPWGPLKGEPLACWSDPSSSVDLVCAGPCGSDAAGIGKDSGRRVLLVLYRNSAIGGHQMRQAGPSGPASRQPHLFTVPFSDHIVTWVHILLYQQPELCLGIFCRRVSQCNVLHSFCRMMVWRCQTPEPQGKQRQEKQWQHSSWLQWLPGHAADSWPLDPFLMDESKWGMLGP